MLDTGADTTSLHWDAISSMGLHSSTFQQEPIVARGVGGPMSYVQKNAFIFVQDRPRGGWHYFNLEVDIASLDEEHAAGGLPSLLGRDILNRCRYVVDAEQRSVIIEPHHPDERSGFLPRPT
ncbi:MAG: hypothetical protein OXL97_04045 [Chloroflexota bacterium]|nr:hypothetical protein [Chloroflexota bacterium]MDE2883604.1 hypothetical protein [Chloroflexota bacterium]